LPTSLTHIVPIDQRLLTLETCCGIWYGSDNRLDSFTRCIRIVVFYSAKAKAPHRSFLSCH